MTSMGLSASGNLKVMHRKIWNFREDSNSQAAYNETSRGKK